MLDRGQERDRGRVESRKCENPHRIFRVRCMPQSGSYLPFLNRPSRDNEESINSKEQKHHKVANDNRQERTKEQAQKELREKLLARRYDRDSNFGAPIGCSEVSFRYTEWQRGLARGALGMGSSEKVLACCS